MAEKITMPAKAAARLAELGPDLLDTLEKEVMSGRAADAFLAEAFRQNRHFGSRDRRFFMQLAFSYFRWRGWLKPIAGGEMRQTSIGAYLLDAHAVHPAIEVLAHQIGLPKGSLQPCADRTPPEKAQALAELFSLETAPSLSLLAPDWTEEVLETPLDTDPHTHLIRFIESSQTRPPVWLRSKRRRTTVLERTLKEQSIDFQVHDQLKTAYAVEAGVRAGDLQRDTGYGFEIQDLSSQVVGVICNPQHDEKWWDVCAGAGGKSLQLADLADGKCLITGTDKRHGSIKELKKRARNAKVACLRGKTRDVLKTPVTEAVFDGVLVDAPCSGLGTWSRHPDARWRMSPTKIQHQAERQLELLEKTCPAVKPGGHLVYSVCTLTRAETRNVVEAFLEKRPDFSLETIANPLSPSSETPHLYIWPWEGPGGGMYIARLVRS